MAFLKTNKCINHKEPNERLDSGVVRWYLHNYSKQPTVARLSGHFRHRQCYNLALFPHRVAKLKKMIVKRLRQKHNWSQEQLATMSGLSIRTIQRVESGQSASLETLKSLASVFETDVSKLTEEITVIDKKSETWQNQPWWIKASFLGVRTRRTSLFMEVAFLIAGIALFLKGDNMRLAAVCFFLTYITSAVIRYSDNKGVWDI